MKQQWPFMFVIPHKTTSKTMISIATAEKTSHPRFRHLLHSLPNVSSPSVRARAISESRDRLAPEPELSSKSLRKRRYTTDTCGFFSQASTLVHSRFEPRNSSHTSTQQEKFSISLTLLLKPGSLK
ncbi:hypothetical protein YC2023_059138 [Brassica napus]